MKKCNQITAIFVAMILAFTTTACRQASAPSPEPTTTGGTDLANIFHATLDTLSDVINSLEIDSTIILTGQVTSSDIQILKNKLDSSSHLIKLDLSQVTGLTGIPIGGFLYCSTLSEIILPDSVTHLGIDAFFGCENLKTFHISKFITTIDIECICYCNSLTVITVDQDNAYYCDINGVLFSKDKTFLIQYPNGKVSETYRIPDSVTRMDQTVFYQCPNIKNVIIPASVTEIGRVPFYHCTNLASVIFEDPNGWYRGGTLTDVSDASVNAEKLKNEWAEGTWTKTSN